jgi:hypothetical protein
VEFGSNVIDWLNNTHICPYFRNPPGSEEDLKFILEFWDTCDYEGKCLDEDNCPCIRTKLPRLVTETI